MQLKTILAIFLMGTLAVSCKDDQILPPVPVPVQRTIEQRIQATSWRLASWEAKNPSTGENFNFYEIILESCDHDDKFSFKAQNKLEIDRMLQLCEPGEPRLYTTNWSYQERDSTLSFTIYDEQVKTKVYRINDSTFSIRFKFPQMFPDLVQEWQFRKY